MGLSSLKCLKPWRSSALIFGFGVPAIAGQYARRPPGAQVKCGAKTYSGLATAHMQSVFRTGLLPTP